MTNTNKNYIGFENGNYIDNLIHENRDNSGFDGIKRIREEMKNETQIEKQYGQVKEYLRSKLGKNALSLIMKNLEILEKNSIMTDNKRIRGALSMRTVRAIVARDMRAAGVKDTAKKFKEIIRFINGIC